MAGSMLTYSNLIYTQEGTETQAGCRFLGSDQIALGAGKVDVV